MALNNEKEIIVNNTTFKVRKRKPVSGPNLFKDALHQSRKNRSFNKSGNNTPGGSPRRDRNHRRNTPKSWKFVELFTWIGRKSYESIPGMLREPVRKHGIEWDDTGIRQEERELRQSLKEVEERYARLAWEYDALREQLGMMAKKIEKMDETLRLLQQNQTRGPSVAPPPPPLSLPPPPPPHPLPVSSAPKLGHFSTIQRSDSAPSRMSGPRLIITPEDIANVKLRKAKDHPVRTKPQLKPQQPLVTQAMLQRTRAKLSRSKPPAASTPNLLSDLEKCLLQDTWVSSLPRRRASATFRSGEELRARPHPYPAPRSPRSSRSPRPRGPISPLKYQLTLPEQTFSENMSSSRHVGVVPLPAARERHVPQRGGAARAPTPLPRSPRSSRSPRPRGPISPLKYQLTLPEQTFSENMSSSRLVGVVPPPAARERHVPQRGGDARAPTPLPRSPR